MCQTWLECLIQTIISGNKEMLILNRKIVLKEVYRPHMSGPKEEPKPSQDRECLDRVKYTSINVRNV